MAHLPHAATDADLVRFADRWAELLEREDYGAAFAFTEQDPYMRWTPESIRQAIKSYGESKPDQRVTVKGEPTDIYQRKEVTWWDENRHGSVGEIWYDLNIDGFVSDLTATFDVRKDPDGFTIRLGEIHVM
jgi:hypothetical protein